jgi:D-amino peptidase
MRLYISADMEGTAGICSWMQCDPNNTAEYPVYRRYMTQEVRAAIEGARKAGVTDVVVNDSHWNMRNLLWDELPGDVRVISGTKPLSMVQGADASFDAAFFTGYHAGIGTLDGILGHTYTDETIHEVRVNGIVCNEALLNAGMLGYHGVPVVLLSGDEAVATQTKAQMPWLRTVEVKRGIGYYAADTMTPEAAQTALRDAAEAALTTLDKAKPYTFDGPITLEIDTTGVQHADFIELMPHFERPGPRTIRFSHDDYAAVFRAYVAAFRLGGAANARA